MTASDNEQSETKQEVNKDMENLLSKLVNYVNTAYSFRQKKQLLDEVKTKLKEEIMIDARKHIKDEIRDAITEFVSIEIKKQKKSKLGEILKSNNFKSTDDVVDKVMNEIKSGNNLRFKTLLTKITTQDGEIDMFNLEKTMLQLKNYYDDEKYFEFITKHKEQVLDILASVFKQSISIEKKKTISKEIRLRKKQRKQSPKALWGKFTSN